MTDQPHDFIGDDLEKAIVADDSPFSRPWLGASSIKDQAEAVFDRILRLKIFFIRYGSSATQDRRDGVKNAFAKIVRFVAEVSQKEEPEWLRESESVVPKLQEFENELRANLARFLVPALYDSGCFHDLEGLHREAERRVADAKDEIESIAAEQVDRVRDEVALLSVEEAQKQFSEAQKKLDGRRRG